MKGLAYKEGQEFCSNCGSRFESDENINILNPGDTVTVSCPNNQDWDLHCNRGSWATVTDNK